ncbi:GtrA family protein [Pseudonocardia sp. KRD-291]|nr:GtrA family protein [Pseudonocardia sp. KRD291]
MVGVANAAVYYTTYRLVLEPVGYLAAHALGLAVAMVVSYFLHCRFTFSVRPTWRRFLRFPWSQATNIAATTIGVVALVHLGVGERVAPLAAAVVAVPITFLLTTLALTGRRSTATGTRVPA